MCRFLPLLMLALLAPAATARFQLTVPKIMRGTDEYRRILELFETRLRRK